MKIAICGAHWVGKTTISRKIAEEFDLEILPDIVVDAYNMGLEINEWTPIETQTWLIWQQMANEKIKIDFVADKCIFDYYVYAKALGMDEDVVSVAKKVAMKTYNYDYVFYVAPEFPIEDDGIRSTDPNFQASIDKTYKNFLDDLEIDYVQLTWTIEARMNQILDRVNQ